MILKRQYRFYKNIISERDWPMLRHTVCQSRDNKPGFIQRYDYLLQQYACVQDNITNNTQKLKSDVTEKANRGKSKCIAYIKNNSDLKRSQIYN